MTRYIMEEYSTQEILQSIMIISDYNENFLQVRRTAVCSLFSMANQPWTLLYACTMQIHSCAYVYENHGTLRLTGLL